VKITYHACRRGSLCTPSVVIRPRTLSGLFVARILALDRSPGADSSTLPLLRWLSDSETVWVAGEAQGRKRKS
jgi:hypothetical protein